MEFKKNIEVLILDDDEENIMILKKLIFHNTEHEIIILKNGNEAYEYLKSLDRRIPDIIMINMKMGDINAYMFTVELKKIEITKTIPIIYIIDSIDVNTKIKVFENGGDDFVIKPFEKNEIINKINNMIKLKTINIELESKDKAIAILNQEIEMYKKALKSIENKKINVNEKEQEIQKFKKAILTLENKNKYLHVMIDRKQNLSYLIETRALEVERIAISLAAVLENTDNIKEEETIYHLKRVSKYSSFLAEKYGCDNEYVKKLSVFAIIHDIGKISVPKEILRNPGVYNDAEREIMKNHTVIGGEILNDPEIDQMGRNITLYHHEKWDGTGYPHGLKGEEIPLEARIVALADVYDALTTKKSYKPNYTDEEIEKIIEMGKGTHFDPKLIDIFFENIERMEEIKNFYIKYNK